MSVKCTLVYQCGKKYYEILGGLIVKNKENVLSARMKKCAEKLISAEFDGNISRLCEEL